MTRLPEVIQSPGMMQLLEMFPQPSADFWLEAGLREWSLVSSTPWLL